MKGYDFYVAENVGHGVHIFLHGYGQFGPIQGYKSEAEAIKVASDRARRENRTLYVIKLSAIVSPQPILPVVAVTKP